MQVKSIRGSEVLLVEDEPLIAIDVAHALEREGAVVHHARDLEPALRMADHLSLSAGIIDLQLVSGSAEIICEKLARRSVPFIFYTGAQPEPPARFVGVPFVQKPSPSPRILGALQYALSVEPRDLVLPLDAKADLLNAIREAEERITRVRGLIARLESLGSDTSASRELLASLHNALETMRYSANIGAAPPWNANR
jgi:DNA-binding NtrC family response regulator